MSYPVGIGSPSYLTLGWGIAFVDLDHDGWEDLYVAHGHVYPQVDEEQSGSTFRQRDALFRNLGDATFVDVAEQAGPGLTEARSSRALLPIDLEGDGDVDLLVTQLGERPVLLRNEGAPGHWLQVRLRAVSGNRDALGARVSVTVGDRTLVREVRRNTSFAGSTLPVAHFGLGTHSRIDALEVRWPSGATTRQGPLEADRQLVLDEPPRPD